MPDSITLQFYDHLIRGIDNGYESRPRVLYYQMGSDEWRTTDDWHSLARRSDTLQYYLMPVSDTLSTTARPPYEMVPYYDPRDPSPTIGGPRLVPFVQAVAVGPQNQRAVEARGDATIYETQVLTHDLSINGAPDIVFVMSSSQEDTDVAVRLCDVYPDGRSMLVTQGIQRLRFRNGLGPQDTAASHNRMVHTLRIGMQNLAMTWRTGHRIRLIVTGSNFPHFERNLNSGGPLYGGTDTLIAFNTFYFGEGKSRMRLPLADVVGGVDQSRASQTDVSIAPNPMHGDAIIRIALRAPQTVTATVSDMLGRVVLSIDGGRMEAGDHALSLDADDLAHGAYVCRVVIGDEVRSVPVMR